jgi:hypothetical protein
MTGALICTMDGTVCAASADFGVGALWPQDPPRRAGDCYTPAPRPPQLKEYEAEINNEDGSSSMQVVNEAANLAAVRARAPARASDDARAILNTYWWGVCVDAVRGERQDRPAGRAREWREVLDYEGAVRPRARAGAGWMMCWAACAHAHPRGALVLACSHHSRTHAAPRSRWTIPSTAHRARSSRGGSARRFGLARVRVCVCVSLLCPRGVTWSRAHVDDV